MTSTTGSDHGEGVGSGATGQFQGAAVGRDIDDIVENGSAARSGEESTGPDHSVGAIPGAASHSDPCDSRTVVGDGYAGAGDGAGRFGTAATDLGEAVDSAAGGIDGDSATIEDGDA